MSRSASEPLLLLLAAAATTVAVGLVDGQSWLSYVIGAVLALALWVMLFCGSWATPTRGRVSPVAYAVAAVVAVVLGAVFVAITDSSGFWSVGFILAGAVLPATTAAWKQRDSS